MTISHAPAITLEQSATLQQIIDILDIEISELDYNLLSPEEQEQKNYIII
jgi:hypothetical protein